MVSNTSDIQSSYSRNSETVVTTRFAQSDDQNLWTLIQKFGFQDITIVKPLSLLHIRIVYMMKSLLHERPLFEQIRTEQKNFRV